jgi:hypothetical protein
MQANWPEPLRRQVQNLVDQWLLNPPAWIGIAAIETLGTTGRFAGTLRRGGRIEPLGGRLPSRAFVWMQGSEPELWVDPRDTGYRDLYAEFAATRLNLPGRLSGADFNIDHTFPKAAGALDGLSHVRLLAIAPASNQSAGRTLEKVMKQRADAAPGGKAVRSATPMTIGKATGFAGWRELPGERGSPGNAAVAAALYAHLQAIGIHVAFPLLEQELAAFMLGGIR